MTRDEYNKLFHKLELNLVAFKPLNDCDEEVLKLVNHALEEEHKKFCAYLKQMHDAYVLASYPPRGESK